jgi:hypothetical protein
MNTPTTTDPVAELIALRMARDKASEELNQFTQVSTWGLQYRELIAVDLQVRVLQRNVHEAAQAYEMALGNYLTAQRPVGAPTN